MKITILTLFPQMFSGPFSYSIIKRAQEKNLVEITYSNIRDFGIGKHKTVDDTPYGGGVGMVLRVDVLYDALVHARCKNNTCKELVVLMDARGEKFHQKKAQAFSQIDHLILICGHYEGVDERFLTFVDQQVSLGDYILTGGELAAMVITDAVVRLIPGVITQGATELESFSLSTTESKNPLLEFPHYTRPRVFKNLSVPSVLLSGNHKDMELWKEKQAIAYTKKNRPDLIRK